MARKDLAQAFRNPPKGGNQAGVAAPDSMGPLPRQRYGSYMGGGESLRDRRVARELEQMTPEQRMEYYKKQWENQPGEPAATQGTPENLRDALEAGEVSARTNTDESGRTKSAGMYGPFGGEEYRDLRNYRRGNQNTEAGDPNEPTFYDEEHRQEETASGASGGSKPDPKQYHEAPVTGRDRRFA